MPLRACISRLDRDDFVIQLCTTTFLIEVSQYIKFGDLTSRSITMSADVDSCTPANVDIPNGFSLTSLGEVHIDIELSDGLSLSKHEEDALLRESTADFTDWIASFIRRVILLFDLVLNMIFDYASTNVRPNAVRAVHQLVECVANAHPAKTLAKFVPFCIKNIEVELENGASSTRTTSTFSTPLPSDATFHWSTDTLFHVCSYSFAFQIWQCYGVPCLSKSFG